MILGFFAWAILLFLHDDEMTIPERVWHTGLLPRRRPIVSAISKKNGHFIHHMLSTALFLRKCRHPLNPRMSAIPKKKGRFIHHMISIALFVRKCRHPLLILA